MPGATNCKSGNSSGNKGSGGWNQQQGGYGGGPVNLGKVCYNFAGKPYIYRGRGRCPIS